MKYGIVGSRKRKDEKAVYDFIDSLPIESIIVSGGCRGVDTWAENAARARGMRVKIFKPDFSGCKKRYEFTRAYHARNKLIAETSDVIVAFVDPSRKGGTENTIKHAEKLGKKVILK